MAPGAPDGFVIRGGSLALAKTDARDMYPLDGYVSDVGYAYMPQYPQTGFQWKARAAVRASCPPLLPTD